MNTSMNVHNVVRLTARRRIFNDFSALILVATDANGQEASLTIFGADRQAPVIEALEDHIVEAENAVEVS